MEGIIISAYHDEERFETKDPTYKHCFDASSDNKPKWILIED